MPEATQALTAYFKQSTKPSGFLESSVNFLKEFKKDDIYSSKWSDSEYINSFLHVTRPVEGIELNDKVALIVSSGIERSLTPDEINYLRDTFGNSIDYSKVRITKGHPNSQFSSITLGNTIHLQTLSGGNGLFTTIGSTVADEANLTEYGLLILAHEITHVWQWQNGGFAYAPQSIVAQISAFLRGEGRNGAYDWKDPYFDKTPWEAWNPEQQAKAMEDYNVSIQQIYNGASGRDKIRANNLIKALTPFVLKVRNKEGAPQYDLSTIPSAPIL